MVFAKYIPNQNPSVAPKITKKKSQKLTHSSNDIQSKTDYCRNARENKTLCNGSIEQNVVAQRRKKVVRHILLFKSASQFENLERIPTPEFAHVSSSSSPDSSNFQPNPLKSTQA